MYEGNDHIFSNGIKKFEYVPILGHPTFHPNRLSFSSPPLFPPLPYRPLSSISLLSLHLIFLCSCFFYCNKLFFFSPILGPALEVFDFVVLNEPHSFHDNIVQTR